jgi:hypothetical protein
LLHLVSSRLFVLYLFGQCLSGLSACSDCDGKQPGDGRKEAVGIVLESSGNLPALEMSVLVEPPADPDRYVPPLASAANRAFGRCVALAEKGDALRRGVKLELVLEKSKFLPTSPAPSDALSGCLVKSLSGFELKEMGSTRRRVTLFIRRADLSGTGQTH